MIDHRVALRVIVLAAGAASIVLSYRAAAGEIRVSGSDCGATVHLVARDAPLSDVLKQLAKSLHFELVGGADDDTRVNVDVARRPTDLVARLTGLDNVSMTLEPNPRCPGRDRIVKLWVLPHKQVAATHTTAAQAEQARREQEGIDMFLRAHGQATSKSQDGKPR